MKLTKEEYEFCQKHIDLIVKIVRTASSSSIDPDYREGLIAIGKKYKIMSCNVCNSALYLGTCRLFNMYESDRVEYEKQQTQIEIENAQSGDAESESNMNTKTTRKRSPRTKKSE